MSSVRSGLNLLTPTARTGRSAAVAAATGFAGIAIFEIALAEPVCPPWAR